MLQLQWLLFLVNPLISSLSTPPFLDNFSFIIHGSRFTFVCSSVLYIYIIHINKNQPILIFSRLIVLCIIPQVSSILLWKEAIHLFYSLSLYQIFLIQLFISGNNSCFYILAIINNDAINIGMGVKVLIFFQQITKEGLLYHMIDLSSAES